MGVGEIKKNYKGMDDQACTLNLVRQYFKICNIALARRREKPFYAVLQALINRIHDGAIGQVHTLRIYRVHGPVHCPRRPENVNELAFLGLNIVPVYPLCLFGDYIVFNSIEFWSGDNVISEPKEFKSQGK